VPRVTRFGIEITAGDDDIDELGHVSNLVYVRWVLDVAMGHSRALGYDFADYRRLGAVFVVRRHEIDYVAQVTAGQVLRAETWVPTWRGASCVRHSEIARGEQVIARAQTTWAFIGLASGRPQRIPEEIRAMFA
jgi:acyl-CoA thioester hydrolase